MLTYEQNVKAILKRIFAGYKDEIIENACTKICALKLSENINVLTKDSVTREFVIKALNILYYDVDVFGSEEKKVTIIEDIKPSFLEIILTILNYIESEEQ